MSQQINLFNPIYRKKGFSFTSATAMLSAAGIGVAAMAIGGLYADNELRATKTAAAAVDAEFKAATARRDKLTAEATQQKPDAALEKEVADLDMILRSRQEIVETLRSGAIGNTQGFSEFMLAFSRQSVSGLWLTGFDVASAGNELAIQGRTMNADLVAKYLARLNQEKALNGRQFGAMRISRPVEAPAAQADPAKKDDSAAKKVVAKTAPYLEFSVSTMEIPASANAVGKVEPVPVPILGPINAGSVPINTGTLIETAKAIAAGAQK
jgi:Tfp pilus assembly protein PilN